MELTDLERDFLRKLLGDSEPTDVRPRNRGAARGAGSWETEPLPSGDIEYRITDAGRAAATT
ncbi:hypothetical protein [Bradyrhizobium yuanmingense]|uniref:hypothetical protein n=1 Tax=Bradyrhizobium yuanmingense TaxID=108015 RepID=UPI0023B9C185|nr:hypothetical protein [Bradyrhizobium yuanmingense]MDF0584952.1 hypothetical protein [Bradyrhizobium yuanmingense]